MAADVGDRRPRCCGSGWPRRRPPSRCASRPAWRWSTSSPPPRCASRRCPTWPAAWCSAGSPSRCCAATAPRSTPRSASTCATSTGTRTRRTAPSGSRPWWPAPSRWSGCSASGSAARRADHAPLLEVLTRRYYGNQQPGRRRATRDVAGCRFVTAEHADGGGQCGVTLIAATAADFAALPGASPPWASWPRDAPAGRAAWSPTSTCAWAGQPDADAMAARLGELIAAQPLPGPRPPDHHHRGRRQRRALMHHHFTFRPDGAGLGRGPADPRPAPADRPADAAGAAARVRPHPAAVGRRGGLPVPGASRRANPADERLVAMAPGPRPHPAARGRRPARRAARGWRTRSPPAWTRSASSRRSGRRTSASTPTGS